MAPSSGTATNKVKLTKTVTYAFNLTIICTLLSDIFKLHAHYNSNAASMIGYKNVELTNLKYCKLWQMRDI